MPPLPTTVYRPARTHPRAVPGDGRAPGVAVAAPPVRTATSRMAWLAVLVPLAGSAGSVGFLLLLPGRRSVLAVALLVGTVLLSLGLGLASRRHERRARRRDRDRYRAYLATVRERPKSISRPRTRHGSGRLVDGQVQRDVSVGRAVRQRCERLVGCALQTASEPLDRGNDVAQRQGHTGSR
jgi:hypothetical protein